MRIEDLAPADLQSLLPALEDLRHDLGKYIQFEQRFLDEPPLEADLRRALCADLLATHRSTQATEAAWQVWARLRPASLEGDPDVHIIDQAMGDLSAFRPDATLEMLHKSSAITKTISLVTRRMLQRARDLLPAVPE